MTKIPDFDTYQKLASLTAIYPNRGNNLYYPTLGLCGEAGEVAEKVKKLHRDKHGIIDQEFKDQITKELGDVLWYITAICIELNLTLSTVAGLNIEKLYDRKDRNKLGGSGDHR